MFMNKLKQPVDRIAALPLVQQVCNFDSSLAEKNEGNDIISAV